MGNCLSSESKDAGNPASNGKKQTEKSSNTTKPSANGLDKNSKSAMNNYSLSSATNNNGASPSNSSGSTASPLSNVPENPNSNSNSHSKTGNNEAMQNNSNYTSNENNNESTNNTTSPNQQIASSNTSANGRQEVKILLLGSGESGKSTILKQMKIIHQNGYSQDDLIMYKTTVYKNLLDCAKSIVAALEQFEVSLENEGVTKDDFEFVKSSIIQPDPDTIFDDQLADIISKLWASPEVKKIFTERRSEFYIMDSAPYFFANVKRIADADYIPNVSDILRARIKTTGIYETRFEMGKLNIHMFDVGGQRSERRKWINCFDNVTLIIFCVALSEYDQVLLEESTQNRMAESLVLFDSIINSRWFSRTSVVLFLNKIDVFTEKLSYSPLENYFPDYTGGNDIKNAAKYILWRFNKLNRNQVNIYPHLTQATDTSNIRLVFAAVKETILQNSLRDSGIL